MANIGPQVFSGTNSLQNTDPDPMNVRITPGIPIPNSASRCLVVLTKLT